MTLRTCSALLLSLALSGAAARAAEEPGSARDHFKKGQTHYTLGEFNEAVAEFREAYRLENKPAILFNIAQAMRQVGQYKQAYFYYSQYLHQRPEASNRPEVEGFMAAMKKKVDADEDAERARSDADSAKPGPAKYPEDHLVEGQDDKPGRASGNVAALPLPGVTPGKPASTTTVKPGSTGTKVALASTAGSLASAQTKPALRATVPASAVSTAPAAQPADRSGRAVHIAGYSAMGLGVAAGGLAFVFHSSAQSSADQFNQKYASGTLTPADAQLKSEVASKGKLATLAAVGAGVLVVTGAVLAFAF